MTNPDVIEGGTPYYDENGRCPHGIRKPWACDECDAALSDSAPTPHEAVELLRECLPYVNAAPAILDTIEERVSIRRRIDTLLSGEVK